MGCLNHIEAQFSTPDSMLRSSIIVQLLTVGLVVGGTLNQNVVKESGIDEILDASTEYLKHIITSQMNHPDFNIEDLKTRMALTFMDFLEMIPGNRSEGAVGDTQLEAGTALEKFDKVEMIQYTEDILEFFQRLMKRIFRNQMKNPDFKVQDVHEALTKTFKNFFDMVSLYVNEHPKMRALDVPTEKLKFKDPFNLLYEMGKIVAAFSLEIVNNVARPFLAEFDSVIKENFLKVASALLEFSKNRLYFLAFETLRILLDWGNPETPTALQTLFQDFGTYLKDDVETKEQETIKKFMQVSLHFSNNFSSVLSGLVNKIDHIPVAKATK